MFNYSNLIIIFSFFGAIIAALFKHFWILIMIFLIIIIYKILTYVIENRNELSLKQD